MAEERHELEIRSLDPAGVPVRDFLAGAERLEPRDLDPAYLREVLGDLAELVSAAIEVRPAVERYASIMEVSHKPQTSALWRTRLAELDSAIGAAQGRLP